MSTENKQITHKIQESIERNFKSIKLNIETFDLTDKQKSLVELAFKRDTRIVFVNGVAGSSKTFLAVYAALHLYNKNPKYEIKYIRTIAESGEKALGSLPGGVNEKFNPFIMPLVDKLEELLHISHYKYLIDNNIIESLPVNFLRGASWNEKIIIADEAQNYSTKELVTLLTRIGKDTKMFICGDPMQSDINGKTGFTKIFNLFNNEESEKQGIYCFEFEENDIFRSEILKYLVSSFKKIDKI
jgi:phosphate starvation-inducible PhoH-like protein